MATRTQKEIEEDLWDPDDHPGMRKRIEERAVATVGKVFPAEYGSVRLEVVDPHIGGPERFSRKQERDAIMRREYLSRPMKASLVLRDKDTGEELDRRENVTLMKVPYYTDGGTFIHNGNNYTAAMQSRMIPGAYTRVQNNGVIENQFNTRVGTGKAFRVALDPAKAQFRFRVKGSDLHLYSLLKDMGVSDDDMRDAWGEEILDMNRAKYDARATGKAFQKMVPHYAQEGVGDKASGIREALARAQISRRVASRTLANYLVGLRSSQSKAASDMHARFIAPLFKKSFDVRDQGDRDEDGDEYMAVGPEGLLAATRKLLAVNRGQDVPDERHTPAFSKIYTPDKLLAERILLDEGRRRRNLMRRLAKTRSLRSFLPGALDGYMEEFLTKDSLTTPGEETNPTARMSQHRRVTQMGKGGIGSPDAITPEMQTIAASEFGFYSPIEGPECFDDMSEVYTLRGWVPWPEVTADDIFACRVEGAIAWHKADRLIKEHYKGEMLVAESETLRMCVTPGHRVLWKTDPYNKSSRMDLASDVFGRAGCVPIRHEPYAGNPEFSHFQLPEVEKTNNFQKSFKRFKIRDWCAFMGWWLSEGCLTRQSGKGEVYKQGEVKVSQCAKANPENHREIQSLLIRMGFPEKCGSPRYFSVRGKQLISYFQQWEHGCYDKWIPEDLFEAPVEARFALLDALLKGDGRYNKKRWCYCSVSHRLALSVERLAIGLGYTAFIRVEKDPRPHVTTTNYVVSIHRQFNRSFKARSNGHSNGRSYGDNWSKVAYDGFVYCATVPGGLLHVRGKRSTSGFWSGNSSLAGIDVRLANGVRIGSDGRMRRRVTDARTGAKVWVSPEDLVGKKLQLPD